MTSAGDAARGLATESVAAGDPTGWFERLYSAAGTGDMTVRRRARGRRGR